MIKQYQLKDGSVRYSYIAYVGIDPLTGNTQQKSKANQSSVFKPLSTNNWF
ncbi:hypothetical protein [Streptococcus suis]|uniref:hypothetical protein n=1 Tax=Streptococcus suis TaxID=1307 RepID=UPI001EDF00D0|nr:hypothetical protein [Streptococcus suis]